MVTLIIGLALMAIGYLWEQYDTMKAVNASYKFECTYGIQHAIGGAKRGNHESNYPV